MKLSPYETADEERMFDAAYRAGFEDGKGEVLPLLLNLLQVAIWDSNYPYPRLMICRVCGETLQRTGHNILCPIPEIAVYAFREYGWLA